MPFCTLASINPLLAYVDEITAINITWHHYIELFKPTITGFTSHINTKTSLIPTFTYMKRMLSIFSKVLLLWSIKFCFQFYFSLVVVLVDIESIILLHAYLDFIDYGWL